MKRTSNRKRIVILIQKFDVGGAQRMVLEQLKKSDSSAFDLSVLCYGKREDTAIARQAESLCEVTYLNQVGRVTPLKVLKVIGAIRRNHPDVVHAHLGGVSFGTMWSLLFRKPLVITVHTKPEKAFPSKTEKQVRKVLKSRKTTLVAVSEDNAIAVREYFGLNMNNCKCVNNGIDVDSFYKEPHEGFTFINVSRQDENKNQALIIRCFKRLVLIHPDVKLYLLGDGPTHQDLILLKNELNLGEELQIPGNIDEPAKYYAISDCYLQSSHREALPMSMIEAMAANLPLVSTNVGGIKDLIDGNGYLIDDGDEEAYFHAMLSLVEMSKEQLQAFSLRSREIVCADYSSVKMARKYEEIYKEICK